MYMSFDGVLGTCWGSLGRLGDAVDVLGALDCRDDGRPWDVSVPVRLGASGLSVGKGGG